MKQVPTIDLENLTNESLAELDRACADHGFFKLVGHGLNDLIDEVLEQTDKFFAAPRSVKTSVLRPADSAYGYFDRELTKNKRDKKEVFDYHGKSFDDPSVEALGSFDFWPKDDNGQLTDAGIAGFEDTLKRFYTANDQLARRVVNLMCQVMNGEAERIEPTYGDGHTSLARLNHYPSYDPLPEDERSEDRELGDMALGAHTDPSAITLLYQDESGGLQAESTEDGWIDVPPEKYSFVVNVGDLMQAYSNDRYKAANHRVLPVGEGVSRYSLPFFYFPKGGSVIESVVRDEEPVYRPFKIGELLGARMADNYNATGEADTQLANFKVAS